MNYVKKLWNLLEGKKTYLGSLVIFLAGGFKALEWIDSNTFEVLVTVGGAISVYGVRSALFNARKKR